MLMVIGVAALGCFVINILIKQALCCKGHTFLYKLFIMCFGVFYVGMKLLFNIMPRRWRLSIKVEEPMSWENQQMQLEK